MSPSNWRVSILARFHCGKGIRHSHALALLKDAQVVNPFFTVIVVVDSGDVV